MAARVQQALALPTKKEAEMVVDAVVAALEATLVNNLGTDGFTLKLGSFGKFSVRHKAGILRRIPFTGETILTEEGGRAGSSVWADCGNASRLCTEMSLERLIARARFALRCLPAFAKDQRGDDQCRSGISPPDVPDRVCDQSKQGDQGEVTAQC